MNTTPPIPAPVRRRPILLSGALLSLLLLCPGAVPARAEAPGGYPAQPGPELAAARVPEDFRALFASLSARGSIRSTFTESRWFPFRMHAVVLRGEMRYSRALGLSLHYLPPKEAVVIADARGLILRDAAGRSREIRPDGRTPDIGATLMPVLRFEESELFSKFHVRAVRSGEAWRVDLLPRAADLAGWIGTIAVEGRGTEVARIELRRSSSQHIDIEITSSAYGADFGPEERKRFFR